MKGKIFLIFIALTSVFVLNKAFALNEIADNHELTETNLTISVEEIDLGEYKTEMYVGETQLLTPTPIPQNEFVEIKYSSTNTNTAKINGLGRIEAVAPGKTQIIVSVGPVKKSFSLEVKEKEKHICEISEYKERMFVGETQELSVKITPETSQAIKFFSSNPKIASVDSLGKVSALSKGNAIITIKTEEISKSINIEVAVGTEKIIVDNTYLVLRKGGRHKIIAYVYPKNAEQSLTYKSSDNNIATVNKSGDILAKNNGTCVINVSNGDMIASISIIVNETDTIQAQQNLDDSSKISLKTNYNLEQKDIYIDAKDHPFLSKDFLKTVSENLKSVFIQGEVYSITLYGSDIKNWDNELYTNIEIKNNGGQTELIINKNLNLPGTLYCDFSEICDNPKYLYIYNDTIKNFQYVDTKDFSNVKIDSAGKYLITEKNIIGIKFNNKVTIIILSLFCVVSLTVLIIKNKHWFW